MDRVCACGMGSRVRLHLIFFLSSLTALTGCTELRRLGGDADAGLSLGEGDDHLPRVEEDLSMLVSGDDLSMSLTPPDFYGLSSGTGVYNDLGIDRDAAGCAMGEVAGMCPNPIAFNAACEPTTSDPEICNNGLDDNCDGRVDEGCPCTPGAVQRCFLGPPGKLGVGGCTQGTQTCVGVEFGTWDDCIDSLPPRGETCDGLDNDCNGCIDDGLCCAGGLVCPAPGDPRIADVPPYSTLQLKGGDYFSGNGVTWKWTVDGGPCDKLFVSSSFTPKLNPRPRSFTLTNANSKDASVHFTLSGDYTITLTVVDANGLTFTCTWVQHVIGPGVRFELCWDHQGTGAQGGADLDLHVHKPGTTTNWYSGTSPVGGQARSDDCHWDNCTAPRFQSPPTASKRIDWELPNTTPADACAGPSTARPGPRSATATTRGSTPTTSTQSASPRTPTSTTPETATPSAPWCTTTDRTTARRATTSPSTPSSTCTAAASSRRPTVRSRIRSSDSTTAPALPRASCGASPT
jgi:hypothetical protein